MFKNLKKLWLLTPLAWFLGGFVFVAATNAQLPNLAASMSLWVVGGFTLWQMVYKYKFALGKDDPGIMLVLGVFLAGVLPLVGALGFDYFYTPAVSIFGDIFYVVALLAGICSLVISTVMSGYLLLLLTLASLTPVTSQHAQARE